MDKDIRHKQKKSSMLTLAHGITMSGNIVKIGLDGWNPTAFNHAEFMMLVKSMITLYKSDKKYEQWIDNKLLENWKAIVIMNDNNSILT